MLPDYIQFYNKTKFGIDMTDQMARKYPVKSGSRKWPLQIFFNILDLAAINAWILYKEVTGIQIERKQFLFQLTKQLSADYTIEREIITTARPPSINSNIFKYNRSYQTKYLSNRTLPQ